MLIDASRPGAASDPDAQPVAIVARPLGRQTNNVAEYTAVLLALHEAHRLGAEEVELVLDSKLVVEQLSGRWKVRDPGLASLVAEILELLRGFRRWSARHEPRARNRAADALANLALDDPRAAAELERRYQEGLAPEGAAPRTDEAAAGETLSSLPRTWAAFAREASALAAAGERLLRDVPVAYLATVRNDGAPRVHPVTVTFHDGALYLFVRARSPKLRDLLETGHYALHSAPRPPSQAPGHDQELMIGGRARPVRDAALRAAVASVHGAQVESEDRLFELRLERANHTRRDLGHPIHATWTADSILDQAAARPGRRLARSARRPDGRVPRRGDPKPARGKSELHDAG